MKYMGSKRRIAKYIMPLILAERTEGQLYVEPFVGGANSFECVANPRLGVDNNPYLIACLDAIANGWIPPSVVTEDEYKTIHANKDAYAPELVGFVGFGCSFGGKWWNGYARDNKASVGADVAQRNAIRQAPNSTARSSSTAPTTRWTFQMVQSSTVTLPTPTRLAIRRPARLTMRRFGYGLPTCHSGARCL